MGKPRDEMTDEELEQERERVKIAARQSRARRRAETLRAEGKEDEALQVLRDAGLNEFGERIDAPSPLQVRRAVERIAVLGEDEEPGYGALTATPSSDDGVPLSELIEAGELLGTLATLFRVGLDPEAILTGAERDWLERHPYGAAVVEERMILHGLAEPYQAWSSLG